jgi:hypothetical protein
MEELMVAIQTNKTFPNIDKDLIFSRVLDLIQMHGYSIIKKREIADLVIARRTVGSAILDLTITISATEPRSVSFILRGNDRELVKNELLALVK